MIASVSILGCETCEAPFIRKRKKKNTFNYDLSEVFFKRTRTVTSADLFVRVELESFTMSSKQGPYYPVASVLIAVAALQLRIACPKSCELKPRGAGGEEESPWGWPWERQWLSPSRRPKSYSPTGARGPQYRHFWESDRFHAAPDWPAVPALPYIAQTQRMVYRKSKSSLQKLSR